MTLLRYGDSNSDVIRVQQLLVEAGYPIDQTELSSGTFGTSTLAAVEAEQRAAGVAVDGVVGPETLATLTGPAAVGPGQNGYVVLGWRIAAVVRSEVQPVIDAAKGELGMREDPPGSNAGPILKYGGDAGAPWCASFVSWCYASAVDGSPFGYLASAYKIWDWARNHQAVLGVSQPTMPGDVFVILHKSVDVNGKPVMKGHVGLITAELGGVVCTIEGNSKDAVRGLIRPRSSFYAIVRPIPVA